MMSFTENYLMCLIDDLLDAVSGGPAGASRSAVRKCAVGRRCFRDSQAAAS